MEHMIGNLIKLYTKTNLELCNSIPIDGEIICYATKSKTSNRFDEYTEYLMTNVLSIFSTNPVPNACNKLSAWCANGH